MILLGEFLVCDQRYFGSGISDTWSVYNPHEYHGHYITTDPEEG